MKTPPDRRGSPGPPTAGDSFGYALLWVVVLSAVVVAFVASLLVVPVDVDAAAGLVPRIPAGVEGALLAAGILGGAVHITLITMRTYTVRARGWTVADTRLANLDVGVSILVAFGRSASPSSW